MVMIKLLKYKKDIDLSYQFLLSLPNDFLSNFEGYFDCSNNQLKSLQYCPTSIRGSFYCNRNLLTSLQYCPTSIGGYFACHDNLLTSLKYLPKEIGGDINFSNNPDCYEELWRLCKTKLGGILYIDDNKELAKLFNKKYKNVGQGREMLRFQDEILDLI